MNRNAAKHSTPERLAAPVWVLLAHEPPLSRPLGQHCLFFIGKRTNGLRLSDSGPVVEINNLKDGVLKSIKKVFNLLDSG